MAVEDLSREEILDIFEGKCADAAANLAVAISRTPIEIRNELVGAVLSMLVQLSDIDIDDVAKSAKSFREDRSAQFSIGACSSLDDPPKA